MKRSTIRLVIALAALLLIGLVVTQIVWVGKAYRLTQWQLEHDITNALVGVARQVLINSGDSAQVLDPVQQVDENTFTVSINDTLHPEYLRALLTNAFSQRELNLTFTYSIYDCFTDTVVFQSQVMQLADFNPDRVGGTPQIDWRNDGHYFSVTFPELGGAVLNQMNFWIFSTLMLVVVVFFYAFTVSLMLRQKRLSEVRTDFINNMTHELKTPISTIALSADVLSKPEIVEQPDRLQNYARIIRQENGRLQAQVERVLQMAALEREQVQLTLRRLDLHDLIRHAAKSVKVNVEERRGELRLQLHAREPQLQGDEVHLTNIIYNLLDNANKYSPEPPEITLITRDVGRGVEIEVRDRGVGISPGHQKQVFDRFYRVPTGNLHDVKGFGLGLHYVKLMVEAHKGRVSVESTPGDGSCFRLFLPHQPE